MASHSANHSNLYISDVVSPYEVTGFLRAMRFNLLILPLGEVLSLIREGDVLPQGLHLAQVFNLIKGSFGFKPLSFRSWLEKMKNAVEG